MVLLCQILSLLPLVDPSFLQRPSPSVSVVKTETEGIKPRCDDVYVIFARGTGEPPVLGALVGPPLKEDLSRRLAARRKTLSFLGVDYTAETDGILHGGYQEDGQVMTAMVKSVLTLCPTSDVVMSGYSQGAQLTHDTAFHLTRLERESIVAVVTFGDPLFHHRLPPPLEDRRLTFRHGGDKICSRNFYNIYSSHFSYGHNLTAAVKFIDKQVQRRGFKGKGLALSKL